MDTLLRDLRYAVRALARQRGFTLTVVATLALGIGANTAMFSIVNGMLLRPLPYPDDGAIVRIGEAHQGQARSNVFLTNHSMLLLQDEAESFEQLAAYRPRPFNWSSPDGVVSLSGAAVSPSLFPLLRAAPQLGRLFVEEEARAGANQVTLLSHRAWTTRFGSDPDILGRVLMFNERPFTVVGVLAEGFYFPTPDAEVWIPYVIPAFYRPQPGNPGRQRIIIVSVTALGRLRPGVSEEQAATEVRTILQRNADTSPAIAAAMSRAMLTTAGGGAAGGRAAGEGAGGDTPEVDAQVLSLREEMVGGYRPALLALTVATALVLLIAGSNVAGLLLARGVTRQRALAVCAALGAGRGRIVRQLLTESVVLSLTGGALGLAAATLVIRAVPAMVPGDIARLDEVTVDGVVLAFTLGLSVVVGLAFGAVPAFQWSRVELVRTLNEGSAQATGGFRLLRSGRTRAALATAQVALAVVLLVGAGLLLRSFVGLMTVDRGYDPDNVITGRALNPDLTLRTDVISPEAMAEIRDAIQRFAEALIDSLDRMARLPDVAAAGLSSNLPLLTTGGMFTTLQVAGRPPPSDPSDTPRSAVRIASPGYFDVMRLRLRSGRLFTRLDGAGSPGVVVVNETFAREIFGGEPAVGQQLLFGGGASSEPLEVVGVVADIQYQGITVAESGAEAYISVYQLAASPLFGFQPFIAVRTTGDPLAVLPFLREAVTDAHPRATVDDVQTMDARLSAAVVQPRFYAVFVGCFAALALFLAAFGIYGLLSYTVSQRRREIGVRMALGAKSGDIVTLVVRQGALLVAAGAVAGLLAAAASSRVLDSFLYGINTNDRLTFMAAPVVLVAAALVACWLPAHRATRINPTDALRVE